MIHSYTLPSVAKNTKQMDVLKFLQIWAVKLLFPKYWFTPTLLIYAQAWHETGGFSSAIYKENNNLFGMKHPSVRKSTSKGSNRGHAVFASTWSSIYDYFLRQSYFKITYEDDLQYMETTQQSGYAEDFIYVTKWLGIYKALPKFYKYIPFALLPVVVVIAFYIAKPDYFKNFLR